MKLNEFLSKLSAANNVDRVNYLMYQTYGAATRYDVYTNIAELIDGSVKDYKICDQNGDEVKTNRLKSLIKSNLKFRLSTIQGNSSILVYQLLNAYKPDITDVSIDNIYNDVNFTKLSAYLSDINGKLTVTTSWYPDAKHDNQPVYHLSLTANGKNVKGDVTAITKDAITKLAKAAKAASNKKAKAENK